jgi:adenosylcobyric acid synthase
MVLGTSSGAGKSLMNAALCRVLKRRGEQTLPFKGQNMSNNAWVDLDGGEMAYSQAMQAWAAKLDPCCAMNPVLLKPRGDSTSEVIHLGKSVGTARAEHYYRDWFQPGWRAIRSGLETLSHNWPDGRLVLEGAGSPVEVNLQRHRTRGSVRPGCWHLGLAPTHRTAVDPRNFDQPLPRTPRLVR